MKSICNFRYARAKGGTTQFPDVRGLLKYVQYRDDRDDHIPGGGGPDRWVGGGLGSSYPTILARLDELSAGNPHAYCFSIVISPDPEAITAWRSSMESKDDPQARFVEAVQAGMADWETWREEQDKPLSGPIEYTFVVHRPERNYGEQMHAHLILPAATENAMNGDLTPLYNNRPHVEALKEIVYRQLDRVYDLDREREEHNLDLGVGLEPGPVPADREFPFHEASHAEEGV
jgi:hypothetical protein